MLSLPLQGLAASTGFGCGMGHFGLGSPVEKAVLVPCHEVEMQTEAGDVVADDAASLVPADAGPHTAAGCSACAACGSLMALPAPVMALPGGLAGAGALGVASAPEPAFITGGPDRPPPAAHPQRF